MNEFDLQHATRRYSKAWRPKRRTSMIKYTFLWLGFFIRSGFRPNAYKRYRQQKELDTLQLFPPREEWFSPILKCCISVQFRLKTGHSQKWVCKVFEELMLDSVPEFTKVSAVGQVKIDGSTLHVKDGGFEFTVNENGPGELYIHQRFVPPTKSFERTYARPRDCMSPLFSLPEQWTLAYRAGWEVNSTIFVEYLEEMWKQIKEHRNQRLQLLKNVFVEPVPRRGQASPSLTE